MTTGNVQDLSFAQFQRLMTVIQYVKNLVRTHRLQLHRLLYMGPIRIMTDYGMS